jgi:putative ABC transport system permease protein
VISALNRKLLREIWHLRGQMVSIALVVAAGVMTLVTMRGTYESLATALDSYYRDYRFAEVFASLGRAPESLVGRIEGIPGVAAVETRVVSLASLDVPGLAEPAVGQLLSLPREGRPALNEVHLVRGSYPALDLPDQVLISESFATSNGLQPGDSLWAVINGRRRQLEITGIAISPDFIGEIAPGTVFPDDRRFGILRMNAQAVAAAFDMEGAFNDLAVTLAPGASEQAVIDAIDRVLQPYGGRGAYGRDRHPSHEAVMGELEQNRVTGTLIPAIFLGVAAFLLSIVLGRLLATQRSEIGVLKAFGYDNVQVGRHYLRFGLAAVLLGTLIGCLSGIWFWRALTKVYGAFFRFPDLEYRISWGLLALAAAVSVAAAATGVLGAVARAVRLPPAEAMRPEAPLRFRPGPLERFGVGASLPASARMILRNLERRPFRALASATGVALATAILMVGLFFFGAVSHMIDLQFRQAQREDLAVYFNSPRSWFVRHDLAALHGVTRVEPVRVVPVRLSSGHLERPTSITGIPETAELRRLVDQRGRVASIPPEGLLLSATLAEILEVGPGDSLRVELLDGARVIRRVPVAATIDEMFGTAAYMEFHALHRLIGEGPAVSGAYLRIDGNEMGAVTEQLKRLPAVSSAYSPAALRATFEQQMDENLMVSVTFLTVLAGILAIGVIYNSARIALAERGRELASLRVLGFTRREVTTLLLGEQAAITLMAIPFGWGIGYLLIVVTLAAFTTERYRIPLILNLDTYLVAAGVTALAAAIAGLAVRRRLSRMDLIGVLKTRE